MSIAYNKRMYSIKETFYFVGDALRTAKHLQRAKKEGAIEDDFITRIMLAVTEVNGCEVCSYYHTGEALKHGMPEDEIQGMLSGSLENASAYEGIGLLFAQHYAETKGKPAQEAWNRLLAVYGIKTAHAVLGAARFIMVGNTYGIAWGLLKKRLQGKPHKKSSFLYETALLLSLLPFLLMGFIYAAFSDLCKKSLLSFS